MRIPPNVRRRMPQALPRLTIGSSCSPSTTRRWTIGTRSVDCSHWRHPMWYATCALFSPQKS
jgi:hypothetical protein